MTDGRTNYFHVHHRARVRECEPGDEQVGPWSREHLERMDADFVSRVQRAIAAGKEKQRPPAAEIG